MFAFVSRPETVRAKGDKNESGKCRVVHLVRRVCERALTGRYIAEF